MSWRRVLAGLGWEGRKYGAPPVVWSGLCDYPNDGWKGGVAGGRRVVVGACVGDGAGYLRALFSTGLWDEMSSACDFML